MLAAIETRDIARLHFYTRAERPHTETVITQLQTGAVFASLHYALQRFAMFWFRVW